MTPLEAARQAFRLLLANPLRSVLTLFGLTWGAAAVIFLLSWGAGLETALELAFERAGRNLVLVFPGRVSEEFSPASDRRWLYFTPEDVENLRARARESELVAGESQRWLTIDFEQGNLNADVRGVEPEGITIRGVEIAAGRGIRRTDVLHADRVAVLGHDVRRDLLGARGGLGSTVRIEGNSFRVVGMLARVGTQLTRDGAEIDDQVWIPRSTHSLLWPAAGVEGEVLSRLLLRVRDRTRVEEAKAEARAIVAGRMRVSPTDEEAIAMFSAIDMLDTLPIEEQNTVSVVIAAMTLGISGIGILAMMLDGVRQRRSEIGVCLAVGARRRDIVWQFFLETFTLVLLGGGLGIAIGVGGALLLGSDGLRGAVPPELADLLPIPELTWGMIALTLSILVSVGVAAGSIPAWRAARIDPATTLRAD